MSFIVVQILNGLTTAMFLFLIASGLSLIFGVLGVLNFAHGSLYMVGAYLVFTLLVVLMKSPEYFWLAIILAPIAVAAIGGALERGLLRRLYRLEVLYQLLLTYAVILIASDAVKGIWGATNQAVPRPAVLAGSVDILGHAFPAYNILVLVVGPLVLAGIWYVLQRTRWGRIIRAAASDREMISALGVNVGRVFTTVFVFGALLAGLGGALVAAHRAIYPGMDFEIIVECFIVVVIGGLGSIAGTFLGAIIIGQVDAFGILWFPDYAIAFLYIIMAVVLIVRPWGLLGKPMAD